MMPANITNNSHKLLRYLKNQFNLCLMKCIFLNGKFNVKYIYICLQKIPGLCFRGFPLKLSGRIQLHSAIITEMP